VLSMATTKKNRKGALPERDEEGLIRQAKFDPKAFGELYERHIKKIYTYVYYRIGNHADAEDLTSRVFQKAFVHLPSYAHQGLPFSAWLYRIAHNMVANWYRDQSRRKIVGLDEATRHSTDEEPGKAAERTAERDVLLKIIRQLSADKQQVLILKFAEGYSNSEIGAILGKSEGAVKSLYHRTLLQLRETVEKNHGDKP
jgi:RNA polymerase sigma-70 factor, ECF subfamily